MDTTAEMAFELPDTLPEDLTELEELRNAAVAELEKIAPADGEAPSQEVLDQMRRLDEAITKIDGQIEQVRADLDERAGEAANIRERVFGTNSDDDTDQGESDEDDVDEDTPDEEEFSNTSDDTSQDEAEEPPVDEDQPDAVVAAGARRKTRFAGAARGRKPETPPAAKPTFGYVLDANVRDYKPGFVDDLELAKAFGDLAKGRGNRITGANGRSETTFASFVRPTDERREVTDEATAIDALEFATNEKNLEGGSLVAAGGWCAPSETVYDFLGTEAAGDLLSLPEISVKRGGVKFPVEPDFSTIYTDFPGFHQTEAQAQAGTEKACQEIPCGDFTDLRLDVIGLCITNGILADKAWPELTRKYVGEIMKAHQHRISKFRIDKVVAGSTSVSIPAAGLLGAAGALLNSVELAVEDIRVKHRIPSGTTIEGIAPVWARSILRADLAYRDGVLPEQVTNQMIDQHFALRGVRLQFVVDWQDDVIGGTSPAQAFPGEVKIALYPAGTWYSALEPVINLGIIHDMSLLKVNKQTQMFTEDGIAVGKRKNDSRVYTIPVAVNGQVGLRAPLGGPVEAPTEP